jgi:hypothetical protein
MKSWAGFDREVCSAVLPAKVVATLNNHLDREDGQEDLSFVLWQPSLGRARASALVIDVVLPQDNERHVHGNASFESEYFARCAAIAREQRCGLGFIHSHPGARTWQGLSSDDFAAESGIAAQSEACTGLPLLGLTLATGNSTFSARFWKRVDRGRFEPQWCESVRVSGKRINVHFNPQLRPIPAPRASQVRTVSAWGERIQADLARLRIGVIGAGSVGAQVAESLVRTGVANITMYDFDLVEEKNLDRLLHATMEDALDMDVLFCCVDRPWGRQVVNYLAYAHLIPAVDGGVNVELTSTRMRGAEWRAHVVTAGRCCLECLGQFDPADVSLERFGLLDDPPYIQSLATGDSALPSGENVFAFSAAAAAAEVLQFLASFVQPAGVEGIEPQIFHFANGKVDLDATGCAHGCLYSGIWFGRGDSLDVTVTGPHHAAEAVRSDPGVMRRLPVRTSFLSKLAAKLRRPRFAERRETK